MNDCTLSADELPARSEAWRDLLAQATRHAYDASYCYAPEPTLAGRVAGLAATEPGAARTSASRSRLRRLR